MNNIVIRDDEPMKILKQCYNGTRFEWLFLGDFTDRVHTFDIALYPQNPPWPEKEIKTEGDTSKKILKCLITIVSQTIECIENSKNKPHIKALMMYFDAHVPLMCAFEDASAILTDKDAISLATVYEPKPYDLCMKGHYQMLYQI